MHQPYYKDALTGYYRLPWVRLHGIKDYLDMVEILEDFPNIHQTFNVVPSLIEQLIDYTEHAASDIYMDLTLKPANELTLEDKIFILENFFLAHWENMIKPYPRYYELLSRRGFSYTKSDLARIAKYFSDEDMRDLQALFNLAWFDPSFKQSDPALKELHQRGKDFTEADKRLIIDKQLEIIRGIIPKYRKLAQTGQIELSVTPYYHPILPLLWDTDIAKVAMPNVRLPRYRFNRPEDAIAQIQMALKFFEDVFGYKPAGMWPSEGSVSEDIAREIKKAGIRWIATDEGVLSASLMTSLRNKDGYFSDPRVMYRPYDFEGLTIFFRDHSLSDLVGFVYSGWDATAAARDFVEKFAQIRNALPDDKPYVVPVILDGENAWEYYKNDGHDFLRQLYSMLSEDSRFKVVTMSEFISVMQYPEKLHRLHPGSWINANFGIWIGHEEDNLAWDYLTQTRDDLEAYAKANPDADLSEAWRCIYRAEGSDWNWWYGDEHSTENQIDFDELFRNNLIKVYKLIGKDVPQHLYSPVLKENQSISPIVNIRGFITPKIDGYITSYFEWYQAAYLDVKRSGGSMHKSQGFVSGIYYGFNKNNLYINVQPQKTPFSTPADNLSVEIDIIGKHHFKAVYDCKEGNRYATLLQKNSDDWHVISTTLNAVSADIFEIEIPFAELQAKEGDELLFSVEILKDHNELERCPWRGHITVTVPMPHYETMMWY